jgi:hypothetical protein
MLWAEDDLPYKRTFEASRTACIVLSSPKVLGGEVMATAVVTVSVASA